MTFNFILDIKKPCMVHCRMSGSFGSYSPVQEIQNLDNLSPFFPDGTACKEGDSFANFVCLENECVDSRGTRQVSMDNRISNFLVTHVSGLGKTSANLRISRWSITRSRSGRKNPRWRKIRISSRRTKMEKTFWRSPRILLWIWRCLNSSWINDENLTLFAFSWISQHFTEMNLSLSGWII